MILHPAHEDFGVLDDTVGGQEIEIIVRDPRWSCATFLYRFACCGGTEILLCCFRGCRRRYDAWCSRRLAYPSSDTRSNPHAR